MQFDNKSKKIESLLLSFSSFSGFAFLESGRRAANTTWKSLKKLISPYINSLAIAIIR